MRHLKHTVAALVLIFVATLSLASSKPKTIKVLAIGNSFSVDAVEQNLWNLADADGVTMIIGNMYIGGCSLERHVKNLRADLPDYSYRKVVDGVKTTTDSFTLEKALADEDWDFISVQQCSPLSGKYDSYAKDLPELVAYVRAKAPEAKLMLHVTWAYAANSTHKAFPDYGNDQMRMYDEIISANKKAAKLVGIKIIIPCGTAIQNARTSVIGDRLNRDGYHLDKLVGRYTAACTWYEAIFGKSVIGNAFVPEGLSPEWADAAQKSAHKAIRHPDKITVRK